MVSYHVLKIISLLSFSMVLGSRLRSGTVTSLNAPPYGNWGLPCNILAINDGNLQGDMAHSLNDVPGTGDWFSIEMT